MGFYLNKAVKTICWFDLFQHFRPPSKLNVTMKSVLLFVIFSTAFTSTAAFAVQRSKRGVADVLVTDEKLRDMEEVKRRRYVSRLLKNTETINSGEDCSTCFDPQTTK